MKFKSLLMLSFLASMCQNSFAQPETRAPSNEGLNNQTTSATPSSDGFIPVAAELLYGYALIPGITPFVNAALIQVANYTNSGPLVDAQIVGSLPLLDMNESGFRVGGGVAFTHDKLRVRIEDKYYNANIIFVSNQILLGLEYLFS